MDSYTITIAPNDDSGAATRLVVDTSGDQVRITDVHLHAPQGLSSGHIPTVDFGLLLQAVTGTVTASPAPRVAGPTELSAPNGTLALEAAADGEPGGQPTGRQAPRSRARKAAPRAATTRTAKQAPAKATTTRVAKQAPAKATRAAAAAKTPRKPERAAARSQKPAKQTREATTGRVYRRTPDDLGAVLEQVETVAGVAAHYQVPRHTAQGWVSRLRATA